MNGAVQDGWDAYLASVTALVDGLRKSSAVNVNSAALKDIARAAVQGYFRVARPNLLKLGLAEKELSALDAHLQNLNQLLNGNNAKTSYQKELIGIRKMNGAIGNLREVRIGMSGASGQVVPRISPRARKIIAALSNLVPTAALSFEQALSDMANEDRKSYRGTAAELREALREVIDHFAPDADVEKAPWYKPEKERSKPTTRQKMRFILKAREETSKAITTADETLERMELGSEKLARAIQDRSSVATHVASSRKETMTVYRYAETLLAELLQVEE